MILYNRHDTCDGRHVGLTEALGVIAWEDDGERPVPPSSLLFLFPRLGCSPALPAVHLRAAFLSFLQSSRPLLCPLPSYRFATTMGAVCCRPQVVRFLSNPVGHLPNVLPYHSL